MDHYTSDESDESSDDEILAMLEAEDLDGNLQFERIDDQRHRVGRYTITTTTDCSRCVVCQRNRQRREQRQRNNGSDTVPETTVADTLTTGNSVETTGEEIPTGTAGSLEVRNENNDADDIVVIGERAGAKDIDTAAGCESTKEPQAAERIPGILEDVAVISEETLLPDFTTGAEPVVTHEKQREIVRDNTSLRNGNTASDSDDSDNSVDSDSEVQKFETSGAGNCSTDKIPFYNAGVKLDLNGSRKRPLSGTICTQESISSEITLLITLTDDSDSDCSNDADSVPLGTGNKTATQVQSTVTVEPSTGSSISTSANTLPLAKPTFPSWHKQFPMPPGIKMDRELPETEDERRESVSRARASVLSEHILDRNNAPTPLKKPKMELLNFDNLHQSPRLDRGDTDMRIEPPQQQAPNRNGQGTNQAENTRFFNPNGATSWFQSPQIAPPQFHNFQVQQGWNQMPMFPAAPVYPTQMLMQNSYFPFNQQPNVGFQNFGFPNTGMGFQVLMPVTSFPPMAPGPQFQAFYPYGFNQL